MISADLHPEELLDKAAAGTLTDAERTWLDGHLAQCAVCRFEAKAKADFAAAVEPEAVVNVDDVVARALAGMPQREPARARGGRRFGAMTAAAVMFFAVASFAAVGQVTGVLPKMIAKIVSGRGHEPEPVPARETPKAPAPVVAPPPVEAQVVVPESPEPAPAPVVAPRPARRVVVPALGAAELFAEGNGARVRGDLAAAALRYRDLLARFPSSDEAQLTRAVLGRMLLDSGDCRGALEQLEAYLSSGDPTLREEAMAARARCLGVLGRTDDAAAAWSALAAEFPDSLHARHAPRQ